MITVWLRIESLTWVHQDGPDIYDVPMKAPVWDTPKVAYWFQCIVNMWSEEQKVKSMFYFEMVYSREYDNFE